MAGRPVMLMLYLGGQIIEGDSGSQYSASPTHVLLVDPSTRWTQFIRLLHNKTGIDSTQFKVKVACRYPVHVGHKRVTYTHIPVEGDDVLRNVLSIPKYFPNLASVELYIDQEPIEDSSGLGEPQSFVPETNIGSFTQFMNAATEGGVVGNDWMHYGAFIANDAMMMSPITTQQRPIMVEGCSSQGWEHHFTPTVECNSNRDQWRNWDQAGPSSSAPQAGGTWEAEQITDRNLDPTNEYLDNQHQGPVDEDPDDEAGAYDDEGPDEHLLQEEMQDEGVDIPFYSDIGNEGDHFVDAANDYDRPVWVDDRSSELELGMVFKSKESVQHAVKCWSVRQHRYFTVQESTPESWFVRCKLYREQNCQWRLRVKKKKMHGLFEITKLNARHSCFPDVQIEDHSNLDCNMIGRLVSGHVKDNALYTVADIRHDVNSIGVTPSYKKAWLGKKKAIEMVYGNWETSYTLLPRFMCAMQATNPGTVVEWRHTESGAGGYKIFHSVFWAFGPCIEGFKHCRPVITIDGTFQYGKYREKILIAVAVDAAGHIVPLAFAIVDEESLANWSWFLHNLRVHVIQSRQGVCLISDRAPGILSAIDRRRDMQPPVIYHRFCLRHLKVNFSQKFKNTPLTEYMHKAAMCHQARKFTPIMNVIKELSVSAYNWLMAIPLDKWTICYDGGRRYGIMTTNRSESFNSVLKGARKLPITACVRATFYRMNKIFNDYRNEADDLVRKEEKYPPEVYKKLLHFEHKSKFHRVVSFIRAQGLYEVQTGIHGARGNNDHEVKLNEGLCSCNKLTIYKLPCSHAFKVCSNMGRVIWGLVDRFYSTEEMVGTYSAFFRHLRHQDYWPPSPFHLIANVDRLNSRPGRPRSTRFPGEMDRRRTHKCRACGHYGHNYDHCPDLEHLRARARENS